MIANLLEYNKEIVGIRLSTASYCYDLSYKRLLFYFETDESVKEFLSKVNNDKIVLKEHNGIYITDEELKGKKVLEVTNDSWGSNLLEVYTKDKDFNIGKKYKYRPTSCIELNKGAIVTVVDVDFDTGKAIVESENHLEYLVGLRDLVK